MRVMEAAVQRLARKLRKYTVTVHDKDGIILPWGQLLRNINNQAIQHMPKGTLRDQWSEACTLLFHVKNAWRNDTMHPADKYTIEEAKKVLYAVKSFMEFLASLV
jgi:hypothetical protein